MAKPVERKEKRQEWKRTGKTVQEASHNGKGIITLAEEVTVTGRRKTRLVQVGYTSSFPKKSND